MKYRSKPVEIKAMQWHAALDQDCDHQSMQVCAEAIVAWVNANGGEARYEPDQAYGPRIAVRTINGWAYAAPGHYVVKGTATFGVFRAPERPSRAATSTRATRRRSSADGSRPMPADAPRNADEIRSDRLMDALRAYHHARGAGLGLRAAIAAALEAEHRPLLAALEAAQAENAVLREALDVTDHARSQAEAERDAAAVERLAKVQAEVDATGELVARFSRWLESTPSYQGLDPEALVWRRIAKITEENGEVTEAWLGAIGENPRKGVVGCADDVVRELLDVALCALGAVEHFAGFDGSSSAMLADHAAYVCERAGIPAVEPAGQDGADG